MLTQKELKEILNYNKETGIFTWLITPTHSVKVGDIAGSMNKYQRTTGYISISFNNARYWAHRLAWFYVYGKFPKDCIDHINHNKSDNRICNLREVTNKDNHRNLKLRSDNTSGVNGIYWFKRDKKWDATIYIDGKKIHLGLFSQKKDAVKAREEANIKYGFHPNHGKR